MIGEGAYGKVYIAVHQSTGLECAVKVIEKEHIESIGEHMVSLMR